MNSRKLLLSIIFLIILPVAFSEIVLQTTTYENSHDFVIDKYYFQAQQQPTKPEKLPSILIEPLVTESTINACEKAELTFKVTNPSLKTQVYSFKIDDFIGTAYLFPNLIIPAKESRIINFVLVPNCNIAGNINPKLIIETEYDHATLPVLLHIGAIEVEVITETDCKYYFNETVCDSEDYIRFYQGNTYVIDLSEMFFDPDGDKLFYSANAQNIKVKIKDDRALLKPRWDWYGAEEIVFKADDMKGGNAVSRMFFIHVLHNGKSHLENFILGNWVYLLSGFVLLLIFVLLLVWILKPENNNEEHS